ncbi:MAG: lipid II flippase MurJ [Planctomycetota bacterium]
MGSVQPTNPEPDVLESERASATSPKESPVQQTVRIGVLSALNLTCGFATQTYLLVALGVGVESDAYFAALAIPQLFMFVVGDALLATFVPIFSGRDRDDLNREAWTFLSVFTLGFGLLCTAAMLTAPLWVGAIFPGFEGEGLELTIDMVRITMLGFLFQPAASVLWAVYQARQSFYRPEVVVFFTGLSGLASLAYFIPRYGVTSAAWVFTARVWILVFALLPAIGKFRKPSWSSAALRTSIRRSIPLLIGNGVGRLDEIVSRSLASLAPAGGLSLLAFARLLYHGATVLIGKSITAPMIPILSTLHKRGDEEGFRRTHYARLRVVSTLPIVGVVALILLGPTPFEWLVGYGHVTEDNVETLWQLCVALSAILIAVPIEGNLASAYYARGDTVLPAKATIFGFVAGTIAKFALFFQFGLIGIALGAALQPVSGAAFLALFRRRGKRPETDPAASR